MEAAEHSKISDELAYEIEAEMGTTEGAAYGRVFCSYFLSGW